MTLASYLEDVASDPEPLGAALDPAEAAAFLDVLTSIAGGEGYLSYTQKYALKRGTEAMMEERSRVGELIEDFKLRINPNNLDVSYRAVEGFQAERDLLDTLFPDRQDDILKEGQRAEYLEMQQQYKKRRQDLEQIIDLTNSLCRQLGIQVDPSLPSH